MQQYSAPTRLSHASVHTAFAAIEAHARACNDHDAERAAILCRALFPAFVVLHGSGPTRAWLASSSATPTTPPPSLDGSLLEGTAPVYAVHEALRAWDAARDGQTRVDVLMRLMAKA